MAVYSVLVVAYWQFLLQSRLSDSIKQYNELYNAANDPRPQMIPKLDRK